MCVCVCVCVCVHHVVCMHLARGEGPDVKVVHVDNGRELLHHPALEVLHVYMARDGLQQDVAAFRTWWITLLIIILPHS